MANVVSSLMFMLAQNAREKDITILGIAFFAAFMMYLIIDSTVKNRYIPKKGPVRSFLIFLLIVAVIAIILLIIFYK